MLRVARGVSPPGCGGVSYFTSCVSCAIVLCLGFPSWLWGGVLPYLLYLLCHCLVFVGAHCLYSVGILGWLHLSTESMTMTIVEYRARRRYHNTKYEGFDCPLIRYKESGLRLCLVYQNWLVVHSYGLGYYYYGRDGRVIVLLDPRLLLSNIRSAIICLPR